jgi:hypothetical protein
MKTEILDVRDLSTLKDGTFTHVITNLGLPVPGDLDSGPKIVIQVFRVLKEGGVALIPTWSGKEQIPGTIIAVLILVDLVWLTAFYNAARVIRPHETPDSFMSLKPDLLRASWLIQQLEEGGFGNNVEVKPCVTYTIAASLDELTENMMLAREMFFSKFTNAEIEKLNPILKEELQKLRKFERFDEGVRIGMKAWIGVGRKLGDENEVPV